MWNDIPPSVAFADITNVTVRVDWGDVRMNAGLPHEVDITVRWQILP